METEIIIAERYSYQRVNIFLKTPSPHPSLYRKGSKMYIDALKSSGYKENFTYKEEKVPNDNNKEINKENRRKNRKRKIIWFNPSSVG